MHAQPDAQRPSGPVIECEIIEQAGYASARYRISNPGDAPVGYRFVAVIDNGGNTWSSDPVAGTLDPGGAAVREFRPFPQGVSIERCAVAIRAAPAVSPAEAEPIRFEDVASDVEHGHRAFGGLILGGLGGVGLAWGGAYLGTRLECWGECTAWFEGFYGSLAGTIGGYVLGATLGVGLAWDHSGASSPYGAAFGGVFLGSLFGVTAALLLRDQGNDDAAAGVLLAAPVLGATLVVAVTHQHTRDQGLAIGPLLELRDGEVVAGIPIPMRTTVDGAAVVTVPIAGGQF